MKSIRNFAIVCLTTLSLALSTLQLAPPVAAEGLAASPCHLATVHGSYEFVAPATISVSPSAVIAIPDDLLYASPAAFASQGSLIFTGDGRIILSAEADQNGPLATPVNYYGVITMNNDCTATVRFANDIHFKMKLVTYGAGQNLVSLTPGFVILPSLPIRRR